MILSKYLKYSAIGLIGIIVVGEIYHHFALKLKAKLNLHNDDDELFEVICTQRVIDYNTRLTRKMTFQGDRVQHVTEILEQLVLSATKSIHLAMYIFTSTPLAQALVQAHKKNVQVFVIVDHSMKDSSSTKINLLHAAGIKVRIHKAGTLHHKFCLIDVPYDEKKKRLVIDRASTKSKPAFSVIRIPKSGIAITGSLNWTREALMSNRENFTVSTNERASEVLAQEFFDIWSAADAI